MMSSPTVGEPEIFALEPENIESEVMQSYGQPMQRGMPEPPMIRPAPSFASWRSHTSGDTSRSLSHDSSSSISSMSSLSREGDDHSTQESFFHQPNRYAQNHLGGTIAPGLTRRASDGWASDSSYESASFAPPNFSVPHTIFHHPGMGHGSTGDSRTMPPVAMSIDPNLFRPKHMDMSSGVMSDAEHEDLQTAKPPRAEKIEAIVRKDKRTPSKSSKKPATKSSKAALNMSPADSEAESMSVDNNASETGDDAAARKASHARKQKPNHIPRPRNAFILFRKHVVDSKLIPPSVEVRHQNVSVIVARMWAEAPAEQKEEFNELARIEKEEHMKKYPGYRYQPVYRRTNVIRRRVRKDEAEEARCRDVAELLMKGTSGEQLAEEIKEKMIKEETRGRKLTRSKEANELSKGALRSLKAQQKAAESDSTRASPDWTEASESRSGSPPLREGIPKLSRRSTLSSQPDLAPDTFDTTRKPSFINVPGPIDTFVPPPELFLQGNQLGGWAPPTQTYALPSYNTSTTFSYPQPNQGAFYAFDQALPFSPTAHAFDTSFANEMHQMDGGGLPEHNYPSQFSDTNALGHQGHIPAYSDGPLELSMPAMNDSWTGDFGAYNDNGPFDDMFNPLLQDFSAALMQAEETVTGM